MSRAFDSVLASSDLSLDRVLNTGLPVALVFYEKEIYADLRQTLDELARQYAGKALIVTLARNDAPQAAARFGVTQFPCLVTARNEQKVTGIEGMSSADVRSHMAYLVGEGPPPASRAAQQPGNSGQAASHRPIAVNESDFEREVLRADRPVLVDFWAPWCAPCRMVAPALESLARDHGNVLKIAKVNVDENPALASRYRAMSIPTMIVIQGGREVDRWVGALPELAIRNRVERWIQPERHTA